MSDGEPRGTLGTVRNAALLLGLLADGPAYQQLTDLAERSELSVPTVHRLLRSLVYADLVEQDPNSARYGLGSGATLLASRYLSRLPVLAALSPYLVQLRNTVRRTVNVALLVRGDVVYVDRVDGPDGGPYRHGNRVASPLETAAGRVLVARADEPTWDLVVAPLDAAERELAAKDRDRWRDEPYLRTAGAEVTTGEVAVPVLDGRRRAVVALACELEAGASEPVVEDVAGHLRRAAQAAGRILL